MKTWTLFLNDWRGDFWLCEFLHDETNFFYMKYNNKSKPTHSFVHFAHTTTLTKKMVNSFFGFYKKPEIVEGVFITHKNKN